MKILYINYSYNFSGVNSVRVFELLKYFTKQKIDVLHVTPYKPFLIKGINNLIITPSTKKPSSAELFYSNVIKPLYSVPDNKQEERWVSDVKKYFEKNLKNKKFDFVYINTHPLCLIKIGVYAKILFNSKLIVDLQDPFYFNPYNRNLALFDSLIKKSEEKLLQNADIV